MRGQALIDPAVVGALEPFIVTSWHGHREDKLPPQVAQVWARKFSPSQGQGQRQGQQSNVDLAFLDPRGRVVLSVDAMPGHSPANVRDTMLQAVASACNMMPVPTGQSRALRLPQANGGLRIITTLDDPVMVACRAPVIEVRSVDWSALAMPTAARTLPAEVLGEALRTIYPPGIMDRTDPVSKRAYPISRVSGNLALRPASAREAILSGTVRLEDAGPDGFGYEGRLRVLLTYDQSGQVKNCQGIFEGQYPRYDRRQGQWRYLPLISILERDT